MKTRFNPILFVCLLLLWGCRPEIPTPPTAPKNFVLTDSAGIALQKYLVADSGYWQFTEAWYVYGEMVKNGTDTLYVVKDSTDYYPGSSTAFGSDSLLNYALKFNKVLSVKDEMEILTFYDKDHVYFSTDRVSFDYKARTVFGDPNMWYAPFSEGYFQIDALHPDHMWIHTLRHELFDDYFKVYYKLEKRN